MYYLISDLKLRKVFFGFLAGKECGRVWEFFANISPEYEVVVSIRKTKLNQLLFFLKTKVLCLSGARESIV